MTCFNCKESGHASFKCLKPLLRCSYCHLIGHVLADCRKKSSQSEFTVKSVLRILLDDDSEVKNVRTSDGNKGSKYRMVIKINKVHIVCQVDLGSEATLIRKTDAQNLGLK